MCQASTSAEKTCPIGARPDSRLQINDGMSFSSFSLYLSCAFAKHSRRRVVEKKEVLRKKKNRNSPATRR